MPERIQLRRTKGWRMPENTVKVDRTTKWGNPFVPGKPIPFGPLKGRIVADRRHAFVLYRSFAPMNPTLIAQARAELAGRNLACWCGKDDPYEDVCHAAVLLELANPPGAAEPKKALWAKCENCRHCWPAAYYPIEMAAMARVLKDVTCPHGCAGSPVIAKQEGGALQEPQS